MNNDTPSGKSVTQPGDDRRGDGPTEGSAGLKAEAILHSMYQEALRSTLASRDIACLGSTARPAWLGPVSELAFAGITARHRGDAPPAVSAVLCSTCVDHCEADPSALAATVAADLVHGAAVADLLRVPMYSYVSTGQEIRLTPGGETDKRGWRQVTAVIRGLFDALRLPAGSRLVDTNEPAVWKVLSANVDRDRPVLADYTLNGLYRIDDSSPFPAGTPFGFYYEYYRHNVAQYRRSVIRQIFNDHVNDILVVENIQQVKAVALAQALDGQTSGGQLVTVPAPGLISSQRATRAKGPAAYPLANYMKNEAREPEMDGLSAWYWSAVGSRHAMLNREPLTTTEEKQDRRGGEDFSK